MSGKTKKTPGTIKEGNVQPQTKNCLPEEVTMAIIDARGLTLTESLMKTRELLMNNYVEDSEIVVIGDLLNCKVVRKFAVNFGFNTDMQKETDYFSVKIFKDSLTGKYIEKLKVDLQRELMTVGRQERNSYS